MVVKHLPKQTDNKQQEVLVYEDFLKVLKNEPMTELEKFIALIDFMVKKLNRGITHKEMAMIGIEVHRDVLAKMVQKGYLTVEEYNFGGTKENVYKVRWIPDAAETYSGRRKMDKSEEDSEKTV